MPDSHGNFKGMAVPADAWERIFGKRTWRMSCPCGEPHWSDRPCRPNRDTDAINK